MRCRTIKPQLFDNEILGTADPLITTLFVGLWCAADREGRVEDRPLRIRAQIFPYRPEADVDAMLSFLHSNGFITRYITNEVKVISINKFLAHQSPHYKEPPSKLPAPQQVINDKPIIGQSSADHQPIIGRSSANENASCAPGLLVSGLLVSGLDERPTINQPSPVDPLKARESSKRLAQKYLRDVGGKGALSRGIEAIMAVFGQHPLTTEDDLSRCIENYAAHCERQNTDRDYRLGVANFFAGEWQQFTGDAYKPPPKITLADAARHNREEMEKLRKMNGMSGKSA